MNRTGKTCFSLFAILAALLTSCAIYQTGAGIPTPGMQREKDNKPVLNAENRIVPTAVEVLESQEWVGCLRDAYLKASCAERSIRVLIDSALIATAVMAVQRVVIDEKTTSAGNLALAGAGIALLSERILNPMRKEIYAEGARAKLRVCGGKPGPNAN